MQLYVLQTPSLQRLAAVKAATLLWSQPEIITLIATSFQGVPLNQIVERTEQWTEIEKKVQSNASALSIPDPCKQELSDVIKPIGVEIVVWCQYHNLEGYSFNFFDKLLPLKFCWSMFGTVDYTKTAELIVRDERCDVVRRFEVACLNCLEDEARQLFEFLPNHQIQKYISETVRYEIMDHRILVAYFACTLSGDVDLFTRLFQAMDLGITVSINQYLFSVALYRSSRATCEYFLQKVSPEEKDQVFEDWEVLDGHDQDSPTCTCSLIFYLSRMNDEQREGLFREYIRRVLTWLLRWPTSSLFMDAAQRGWQFMVDGDESAMVLGDVIDKICVGYKDYDYAQWFKELWRSNPAEHKQYFFNEADYVVGLIATKQPEFIRLGLKRAKSYPLREIVDFKCFFDTVSGVLTDESVICDDVLIEYKETAALISSNAPEDEEKRLRSQYLSRLIDMVMESRRKCKCI